MFPWLLFHASATQLQQGDVLELLSSAGARCRNYATQVSCIVLKRRVDHLASLLQDEDQDVLAQHILLWSQLLKKIKDPISRQTHQQYALESDAVQSILVQDILNERLLSGKLPHI